MFGSGEKVVKGKSRLSGLASALELAVDDDPSRYEVVVDAAAQLRNMLKTDEVSLTMAEKVRIIKSISKAKVRALMSGTKDNYRTFKVLDTISSDLVQLL
jgi:hypothetical protein